MSSGFYMWSKKIPTLTTLCSASRWRSGEVWAAASWLSSVSTSQLTPWRTRSPTWSGKTSSARHKDTLEMFCFQSIPFVVYLFPLFIATAQYYLMEVNTETKVVEPQTRFCWTHGSPGYRGQLWRVWSAWSVWMEGRWCPLKKSQR